MPTQKPVSMIIFPGVPSGACIPNTLAIDLATGDLYDCMSGTWQAVTGGGGSGDVSGPGVSTDNAIVRWDGTLGTLVQNSGITVVDAASGTLAGSNSGDVTLAGTPDYITISGQVITRTAVDLAADVTGNLPAANLNSGTAASSSTFWRGDATWATPPSGGGDIQYSRVKLTGGDITTTSTTFVDLTGASITMTTGAHRVRLNAIINASIDDGTKNFGLDFTVDGTSQGGGSRGLAIGYAYSTVGNQPNVVVTLNYTTDVLSAGSHTFKIQWLVSGGTGSIRAGSVCPLVFEATETGLTA